MAHSQPYAGECNVATYYSSLLSSAGITSPLDAARNDMHDLIKRTHRNQLPYSSSTADDVWDALIDVDSDASGENVKLIYADTLVPAVPYDAGTCQYWNREHLWSRSHGVGSSGKDNTDMHHLRPSDCNVNSARNNLYFGACVTAAPSAECDSPAHADAASDTEKDSATFLPPANRRGDVARAILYMDLRYDGDEGSTTSDLVVSDCPETVPNEAGMGYLSQLLQWHLEDPPDAEEIQRNEEVCTTWQGNRNPFIDYPGLASIYHGGSRPLLGDGLGYDCSVPAPLPPSSSIASSGVCSDDSSQSCLSVNDCLCANNSSGRNLGGGHSYISHDLAKGRNKEGRQLDVNVPKLIITGIMDGPLPNGLPKAVELYALDDIADLSAYGIGSANNGGGSDGQEFTLTGSAMAGTFITIASEEEEFTNYFGEAPTFTSGVVIINGDDAIELFFDGTVADTFGDISASGTGKAWEYTDGWAYRNSGTTPGGSSFQLDDWMFSGPDAVDGCLDNASCGSKFPLKSFVGVASIPTNQPTSVPTSNNACECKLPLSQTSNAPNTVRYHTPIAPTAKFTSFVSLVIMVWLL